MIVSKQTDLFEDGDDSQRRRENDECADDGDVELLQRQCDWTDVDFGSVVWVLSLEERMIW